MKDHDTIREYIVICGRFHITVNDMHKFTIEEAETIKINMEKEFLEKLEELDEDSEGAKRLQWRLATLRIEKVIYC